MLVEEFVDLKLFGYMLLDEVDFSENKNRQIIKINIKYVFLMLKKLFLSLFDFPK